MYPDIIGKRINGKISINRDGLIGRGSFGCVFKGQLLKNCIDVAIKRIIKEKSTEEYFHIASLVMKMEPHPNILQHFSLEEDDDFL